MPRKNTTKQKSAKPNRKSGKQPMSVKLADLEREETKRVTREVNKTWAFLRSDAPEFLRNVLMAAINRACVDQEIPLVLASENPENLQGVSEAEIKKLLATLFRRTGSSFDLLAALKHEAREQVETDAATEKDSEASRQASTLLNALESDLPDFLRQVIVRAIKTAAQLVGVDGPAFDDDGRLAYDPNAPIPSSCQNMEEVFSRATQLTLDDLDSAEEVPTELSHWYGRLTRNEVDYNALFPILVAASNGGEIKGAINDAEFDVLLSDTWVNTAAGRAAFTADVQRVREELAN
jgi:hypothetical protein